MDHGPGARNLESADMSKAPDGTDAELRVRVLPAIGDVPALTWDICANPGVHAGSSSTAYNPFISHDFLSALEA